MKAAGGAAGFQRSWIWLRQAAAQRVSVPVVTVKLFLNAHTHTYTHPLLSDTASRLIIYQLGTLSLYIMSFNSTITLPLHGKRQNV